MKLNNYDLYKISQTESLKTKKKQKWTFEAFSLLNQPKKPMGFIFIPVPIIIAIQADFCLIHIVLLFI